MQGLLNKAHDMYACIIWFQPKPKQIVPTPTIEKTGERKEEKHIPKIDTNLMPVTNKARAKHFRISHKLLSSTSQFLYRNKLHFFQLSMSTLLLEYG